MTLAAPIVGSGSDSLDFEVRLTGLSRAFGDSTRATLTGPADAPLLVVLGGISANRRITGEGAWWPGFVGEGGGADPTSHRLLGIDFIADARGDTGPSTFDQAKALVAALDTVGVERASLVGASYGGMVGLSLAQHFPDRVDRLVVISAAADAHPAATALRELQRRTVALGIETGAAAEALSIARGLAMLSYRTPEEFAERFTGGLSEEAPLAVTDPGVYLRARGEAFQSVMSPQRFLSLSASIDRHRVEPEKIATPVLLIGAESDQLVPPVQMRALAARLARAVELHLRPSLYGHDMFLKEAEAMTALARPFLQGGRR